MGGEFEGGAVGFGGDDERFDHGFDGAAVFDFDFEFGGSRVFDEFAGGSGEDGNGGLEDDKVTEGFGDVGAVGGDEEGFAVLGLLVDEVEDVFEHPRVAFVEESVDDREVGGMKKDGEEVDGGVMAGGELCYCVVSMVPKVQSGENADDLGGIGGFGVGLGDGGGGGAAGVVSGVWADCTGLELNVTPLWTEVAGEDIEDCRLASSGGAHDRVFVALVEFQAEGAPFFLEGDPFEPNQELRGAHPTTVNSLGK